MKNKDPNYVVKLEKAIAEKYGEEAIQNPKSNWDEEKEKDYLGQLKTLSIKEDRLKRKDEKIEVDGILMSRKLLNRETTKRTCSVCSEYSFEMRDDVYMSKFDCCYNCYIQWVEDREDRWKSGWRPEEENK